MAESVRLMTQVAESKRSLDDLKNPPTLFRRPNWPRAARDRCFKRPDSFNQSDRSRSSFSDKPKKVMDPQAVLGLAVALQIRSAIAQQNVITLGNMLWRRP